MHTLTSYTLKLAFAALISSIVTMFILETAKQIPSEEMATFHCELYQGGNQKSHLNIYLHWQVTLLPEQASNHFLRPRMDNMPYSYMM